MNRFKPIPVLRAAAYPLCLALAHVGGTSALVALARLTGQILTLVWRRVVQAREAAG